MPGVAVLTYNTPEYAELQAATVPTKRAYCERHGYQLIEATAPRWSNEVSWDRLRKVDELLESGYEYVALIDTDALVMNGRRTVEGLCLYGRDESERPPILTCVEDLNGLNFGVAIFRNCPAVRLLLYAALNHWRTQLEHHPCREQEALRQLIYAATYREHVRIYAGAEQHRFMGYLNAEYGRPADWWGSFVVGESWTLHLPGLSTDRRLALAREYAALAI